MFISPRLFCAGICFLSLGSAVALEENPALSLPPAGEQAESPDLVAEALLALLPVSAEVANNGALVPPKDQWPDTPDLVYYDFARKTAGGRIAYIGSGRSEEANRMVDGDQETYFDFENMGRGAFFVAALAENYPVIQASITAERALARVEVWTLETYPRELRNEPSEDESGMSPILVRDFLAGRLPDGRVIVPDDEEVNSLNIPLPETNARYVLVRVVGKDPTRPIRVNLFSAVGRIPREYLGNRMARSNNLQSAEPPAEAPEVSLPQIRFASP